MQLLRCMRKHYNYKPGHNQIIWTVQISDVRQARYTHAWSHCTAKQVDLWRTSIAFRLNWCSLLFRVRRVENCCSQSAADSLLITFRMQPYSIAPASKHVINAKSIPLLRPGWLPTHPTALQNPVTWMSWSHADIQVACIIVASKSVFVH